MKLILLGSGGANPYKNKFACSYLLQTEKEDILIDSGFGVSTQYRKIYKDVNRLNHVFLTHMHMDHTCELPMILFWGYLTGKAGTYTIYGPEENTKKFISGLFEQAYYFISDMLMTARKRTFDYSVTDIKHGDAHEIDSVKIEAAKVSHFSNFPCLAYKISTKNKKVVISGDTTLCQGIIDICKDADELILDVNMHEAYGHNIYHLIPSEVNKILTESRAKKVYITHQGPNLIGKEQECIDIIKKEFPQVEVLWAEDLMEIEL
jgi:ribonuclease Z